jgi:hypothetical protein
MRFLHSLKGCCKTPIQLIILVWFTQPSQDKLQASKATKLLQLELHKLATKQEQQVKQEDNKVSARGDLECYTKGR